MSEEFTPANKSAGLQGILHILWIIAAAWDSSKMYYTIVVIVLSVVVSYSIFETRRNESVEVQGQLIFFVIFWVGMTFFTQSQGAVSIIGSTIPIRYVDYSALLLPLTLWVIPSRDNEFFGRSKVGMDDIVRNMWKLNFLYIIVLRLFGARQPFEFIALIPMIVEPVYLFNQRKKPPVLTLNIFEELDRRYGSARSLIGNIFFVQTAVIFGFLTSRFWTLVILILATATLVMIIVSTLPMEQMKTKKENLQSTDTPRDKESNKKTAREMGIRLRKELKKPQYNLNHILSTLKEEDLSRGYRVDRDNLTFPSTEEDWHPPVGLVLFPIDLGKYDYRRAGEMLLIGFNKTIPNLTSKAKFSLSGKSQNFRMSGDQITIGDLTFRMKTIVVLRDDWEEVIKPRLVEIDDSVDISYTGFKNLGDLQQRMSAIGRKWIEFREMARQQAMEFIGGLIGAEEAVFAGVDEVELFESKDGSKGAE